MKRIIPYLVLVLTLACSLPAVPIQKTTVPSATPPTSTTAGIPQPLPSPTSTTVEQPAPPAADKPPACGFPGASPDIAKLPDLSALHWENRPDGSRWLAGLAYPARDMIASPDGAHLAVTFELGNEAQMPIMATALIDTGEGENRWLSTNSRAYEHLYQWLPDGRLLWIDSKGDVYVNDRHLHPPVPMNQIEAAAGDIAFLRPEMSSWHGSDWRVDFTGPQWETLTMTDNAPAGSVEGIAADKRYALITGAGSVQTGGDYSFNLWRVPLGLGTQATPLSDYVVNLFGTDGYISTRTSNLAATDVWSIGRWHIQQTPRQSYTVTGILFDLDAGKALDASDLGLDPKYAILGQDISPDGQWLEVDLTDNLRLPGNSLFATIDHVYLTSGGLDKGMVIPNHTFRGWSAHAAILQDNKTGELDLSSLPPDGNTLPLAGAVSVVTVYAPWEVNAPGFVIARPADHPERVQRYDERGKLLAMLDLAPDFNRVFPWWTAVSRQAIYLSVAQATPQGDTCGYAPAIIEWGLKP